MLTKKIELYLITNNKTGELYVGQTDQTINVRWSKHVNSALAGENTLLSIAIRTYGEFAFSIICIDECYDEDQGNKLESHYIDFYNTFKPNGYNMTLGGDGTKEYKHTEETKQKIRENQPSIKGENNPFFGLKHSDESKRLIGEASLGRKHTDEAKEKMSAFQSGMMNRNAKTWKVTCPDGRVLIVKDRKKFCLENGLKYVSVDHFTRKGEPFRGYLFEIYHAP